MGRATQTLWLPQPKQIERIHDLPQGIDGPQGGGTLNDEVWYMGAPGAPKPDRLSSFSLCGIWAECLSPGGNQKDE